MADQSQISPTPIAAYSKKVCLLGDFAVGKTSLVRRFVYNLFDDKYISTIGVKVSRKTVATLTETGVVELTMMLWDLAGNEDFDHIRASYMRGSAGAMLVCDVTRRETLAMLDEYVDQLYSMVENPRLLLAANKVDLVGERQVSDEEIRALADKLNATLVFTSARTEQGVEEAFRTLAHQLLS